MQPIDSSKLSAETKTTQAGSHQDVASISSSKEALSNSPKDELSNKITAAIVNKQRSAINILLKKTLLELSSNGLLSIDSHKAILNAKQILPGEYTQLFIQDRVQQQKLAAVLASQTLKPEPLNMATLRQWFSGQIIQSIVYKEPQNNIASLLVSKTGQFPGNLLADFVQKPIANDLIRQSQEVNIKTDLALKTGQQLLLQVNKNVSEVSFQLKHSPAESNQLSQFINQIVAKQQAMPQLIASLREVATHPRQASTFFTPIFIKQVKDVLQQFPSLSQLSTSKDIKNALQNSGLFLESKIINSGHHNQVTAGSQPITTTDLKAGLSQLVLLIQNHQAAVIPKALTGEALLYKHISYDNLINPQLNFKHMIDLPGKVLHAQVQAPVPDANLFHLNNTILLHSRIMEQLEGVLSRIVINQLQTREGGDQSVMNFEIPFRHNDQHEVLQLKIREQLQEKEALQGNKIWTVNLAFHLKSLGGVRIYITLDNKELAMQFWTEKKDSQHLFQKHFPLLNERLTEAGFSISQLRAFHGMPDKAESEQANNHFIINEKV